MEHLPLDARSVVEELRALVTPLSGEGPRTWTPSASFDSLLEDAEITPVALNDHLSWLHANSDLSQLLAPPAGSGLRPWVKRQIHRAVLAVLGPYLLKVQDCVAVTVRALDTVARRVDEQAAAQLRQIEAVRADLVDLAGHLEKRLDE